MTNEECPMTKEIRHPKSEWEALTSDIIIQSFELRHSFGICHSDFVIVKSLLRSVATTL